MTVLQSALALNVAKFTNLFCSYVGNGGNPEVLDKILCESVTCE